jgi:hypothetical protein
VPEVGKLYRHAFLDAPLRLVVGVEAVEQQGSLLVKKGELLVETVAGGRRFRVSFTPEEWNDIYREVA